MNFKKAKIVVAVAFSVVAGGAVADTTDAERRCVQEGLDRAEAIEQHSDSFLNGYFALLPDLKDREQLRLENPYRCSGVGQAETK